MLVLDRKVSQSIYAHKEGVPGDRLAIRVLDVTPDRHVVLGFVGEDFNVVRSEIFYRQDSISNQPNEQKRSRK